MCKYVYYCTSVNPLLSERGYCEYVLVDDIVEGNVFRKISQIFAIFL